MAKNPATPKTNTAALDLAKLAIDKSNKQTNAATAALLAASAETGKTLADLTAQITKANEELLEAQITLKAETDKLIAERNDAIDGLMEEFKEKSETLSKKHSAALVDLQEKERALKVDFDIRLKENEMKTLKELLAKNGLAEISTLSLKDLQTSNQTATTKISELETRSKTETAKEVKDATDLALKLANLEFKSTEAKLTSQAESLSKQLEASEKQVARMVTELDELRKVMVSVSGSASKPAVVVNTANPTGK